VLGVHTGEGRNRPRAVREGHTNGVVHGDAARYRDQAERRGSIDSATQPATARCDGTKCVVDGICRDVERGDDDGHVSSSVSVIPLR
jgi:hypothetical protein